MAEKLLTGASFKAPDWKGPTIAAAAGRHPAAAAPPDTDMDYADDAFVEPATEAEAGPAAAAAATAAATSDAAMLEVDSPHMPPAPPVRDTHSSLSALSRTAQQQQQRQAKQQTSHQQPPSRRPMSVIRQPGWQPQQQPQPPAQRPQQPQQQQPRREQPGAPEAAVPQAHVNDLPDDVLQRIFSMLPFRKRYKDGSLY